MKFIISILFSIELRLDFNVANSNALGWLDEEVSVGFIRCLGEWHFLPQVRCQESVGLGNGSISCLSEVTQCGGGAACLSVAIFDTSHLQKLLGNWSRDDAGTAWCWNELDENGAALASDLKMIRKKLISHKLGHILIHIFSAI